jgi:hypothetical protein
MHGKFAAIFLFFLTFSSFAQSLRISGNTKDTSTQQPLPNALLMAVKFKDSTLVGYSRSNSKGIFKSITLPTDTYIVIISHPNFNDKTYLLVPDKKDTAFKFSNVVLPPKSVELKEVEIIAFKEKMYYKGDTLQFNADAFNPRENATVEDLLKKLPGVKVDAAGKITIQGKTVDQVLVDGDEFFGSDPTIATRNLNANTVETIQVYDKKNDNTDNDNDATLKVLNLKLKEDAKKGYFGKLSGASDFQKAHKGNFPRFYENDLLMNKFSKSQKISLFGLLANTPKQAFSWRDASQYGLSNEYENNYDPETNSWTSTGFNATGVPQTLKTGFYFSDHFGKNSKVNADYTFKQNRLETGTETNTQFFLQDTSYNNRQMIGKTTHNQSHNFGFKLDQKLDSLTDLTIKPKVELNTSEFSNTQSDRFLSQSGISTRLTTISNNGSSETTDANVQLKLNRRFMKTDRTFSLLYHPSYYDSKTNSELNTQFSSFGDEANDSTLRQKRSQLSHREEHNVAASYLEPISKKLKTEFTYNFGHNLNNNNRNTLDFGGTAFDIVNPAQTNDFRNKRLTHKAGVRLIYDVKKYRLSMGSHYRAIYQENLNATQNQKISGTFNNVLPHAGFTYRFNQGSNLNLNYYSQARTPELRQMQPVVDNSDPNRIFTGNPNLKPQFSNNLSINYYFYKGVSDVNFYSGGQFSSISNEINEKTSFDSQGRAFTTPVNVNGQYVANFWSGGGFPILKRFLKIDYSLSGNLINNVSFVNDNQNTTQTLGLNPSLNIEKELDWLELRFGGNYSYNVTKQSINMQEIKPFYTYGLSGNLMVKLPHKFKLQANGNYTNNGNRAVGYNINFFILNAAISKSFFKRDDLTISIEGNDIFNQNISNDRIIQSNKIIDTKTQIIKRYFLFRLIYKFNSQKSKAEEEDEDYD